jgi:hypothetical protein
MKNEACPNCGGMLGVPDKLRGLPVECPVCRLEFVPGSPAKARQKDNGSGKPSKPPKPSLRSVPLPASISTDSEPVKSEKVKLVGANHEHLMPPSKPRLHAPTPESVSTHRIVDEVEPAMHADSDQSELVIRRSENELASEALEPKPLSADAAKPSVARIIKTELVKPQLTIDGKLPTLHLHDEAKPKANEGELKSNPVFVGLLVCFSLLTSGVMLFVVGMQPSQSAKMVLESRQSISEFYEVRIGEEVAPYQRELREAQLANSRGDFRAEIQNYEKVMARFRAEDRNRFKGLTGSPSGDIELEEHISILLSEAKRLLKRGR